MQFTQSDAIALPQETGQCVLKRQPRDLHVLGGKRNRRSAHRNAKRVLWNLSQRRIPRVTLAKVLNADRSDRVELQQTGGRNPGLLLHLPNSCIVGRFTIFATAGDSLPDAIVGAPEDGVFEVNAFSPIRQYQDLKWCASHIARDLPRIRDLVCRLVATFGCC